MSTGTDSTVPSPETLVKHELIGLPVRIVAARHPALCEIAGTVVRETTKTLVVEADDGEGEKMIPKDAATFAFDLPGGETVRVEGVRLVARPARRTETAGGTRW